MSTKLDADKLAAKRCPYPSQDIPDPCMIGRFSLECARVNELRETYAAAIREVAQHLADERDAYREVLENFVKWMNMERKTAPIKEAEALLSKYPKP